MTVLIFEILDQVKCYHGYKMNERPVSFVHQNKQWEITDIIDQWYEGGIDPRRPIKNYFKVITKEGKIFLLRYNPKFDRWAIKIDKKKEKK